MDRVDGTHSETALNDEKDAVNDKKLFFFARFHVRAESEQAAIEALRAVLPPSRAEAGCLKIDAFRSVRDRRLFYIHSVWTDEAAFDYHAGLPHTLDFIQRMESLVDQPFELTRSELMQ